VISTGGIAGWQVALIAAGAALAAAAVFVDRKLAGRRHHRLIRVPATAHHACLTTGPPGLNRQAGPHFGLSQARRPVRAMTFAGHGDASRPGISGFARLEGSAGRS
jgi:hypothetical protein